MITLPNTLYPVLRTLTAFAWLFALICTMPVVLVLKLLTKLFDHVR